MENLTVLVVGGSAVSGQCAIRALKRLSEQNQVIATSSRQSDVQGADLTLHEIDLTSEDAAGIIAERCLALQDRFDYVVYVPARGEVGMPARLATPEMVEASLAYSVIPYLKLHKALNPRRTIALSGFITMDPMLLIYGAMTFTKIAMEQLAVQNPHRLQILRVGMFLSKSVRGIALLVQRHMMRRAFPELEQLERDWRDAGGKFQDFFWDMNYRFEERVYREHGQGRSFRPTTDEDITAAFEVLFRGEDQPIVNLLGSWSWTEDHMPTLPPVIANNLKLIPPNLPGFL